METFLDEFFENAERKETERRENFGYDKNKSLNSIMFQTPAGTRLSKTEALDIIAEGCNGTYQDFIKTSCGYPTSVIVNSNYEWKYDTTIATHSSSYTT